MKTKKTKNDQKRFKSLKRRTTKMNFLEATDKKYENSTLGQALRQPYNELEKQPKDETDYLIDIDKGLQDEIIERTEADYIKEFAYTQLEQIFNATADGMGVIDKNFNILQINNPFLKMLGISKDETLGKRCYEVFPSSLCHTDNCPLIRILNGENRIEDGIEIECKNGLKLPCILTATPFRSHDSKLIGIIENFKDLSNVKHLEDILQKQIYIRTKERLFDISMDGFYVLDIEGNIVDANKAFTNLIGYSKEKLLGMKIGDLEVAEDPGYRKDHQIMRGFKRLERGFRHKNGNTVRFEISLSVIYRGRDRFFVSFVRDITGRKKIEKQIQFLSYAVENDADGVALADLNGRLISMNDTFAAIYGYNSEEFLGKHISIFHPYSLKEYSGISNYNIETAGEFKGDIWHTRRDGTMFPVKIYKSILRDEAGSPIGNIIVIKDITRSKGMYKSIKKSGDADRVLLNAFTDSAFLIDTDGTILGLNDRAAQGFDKHSDELIGMCLYDFLSPKIAVLCKELISKVIQSVKPVYFSEGLVGKGINENYCPILDEYGKVVKVAIFCRNTTEAKNETYKIEEREGMKNLVNDKGQNRYVHPPQKDVKSNIKAKETLQDFFIVKHIRKDDECNFCFENIISRSPKIWDLFETLSSIAESVSTILIQGESGTGKRLFAKAIHNLSSRRDKPFIMVNCSSLSDKLLESELFAYKAGAFTDAKKDHPGRFALADGGSLFLYEIGDTSLEIQARLLHFLQKGVNESFGLEESIKFDVRIITATNKNLETLVKEGNFSQDLFHLINEVRLDLPPLREHLEDVPLLIDHFINRFNKQYGKKVNGISEEALICLLSHDYPSNVRELKNIIEQAIVLCSYGRIEPSHLPKNVYASFDIDYTSESNLTQIRKMESAFLMNMLRHNNQYHLKMTDQTGIQKTTPFRKIKTLGLKTSKSRRKPDP